MASMEGTVWLVGGDRAARCFREKRARKRAASGEDSEVRVLRRAETVGSIETDEVSSGLIAEGAIVRCACVYVIVSLT